MVDFSTKAPSIPKKVEKPKNTDSEIAIGRLMREIKDLEATIENQNEMLEKASKMMDLDIDGFQKWVKTLNPTEHIEKTLIIQMQKYGKSAFLAYFKSLYQKYQKGIK